MAEDSVHQEIYRSYSLRRRLDLVFGALLVCTVIAGTLALGLTVQQRHDAMVLYALHEQERLADEIVILKQRMLVQQVQGGKIQLESLSRFHRQLTQLGHNLTTFKRGGEVLLDDGRFVSVPAVRGDLSREHLDAALAWVQRSGSHLEQGFEQAAVEGSGVYGVSFVLERDEVAIKTFLRSLSAWAESMALNRLLRAGWLLLGCMTSGLGVFFFGIWLIRRFLTVPLHRMAEGIRAMRKTGRLVKLPVAFSNELGVVASGFNELAQEVEGQKARLREHVVELQRVNEQRDQLTHIKDEFLATISHQFRTPLMVMVESLMQLRDGIVGPLSQQQQVLVAAMEKGATRLSELIENALNLSLVRTGRRPLNCRADDLESLLHQSQTDWQLAGSHTIRLSCGPLPPVYMDARAIQEMMGHLLRNAFRHAPRQTEVLVWTQLREREVEVSVRDDGPGLTEDQIGHLFQPFVHVHTPEAPGSQGTGLGLAFCRQLVERHHGTIRAESSPGHGLTVTFSLPIASPQFLLEESCRLAQEESEYEQEQFGLVLVVPADPTVSDASQLVQRTETLLRSHTHRGDRFVRVDGHTLIIIAVTNQPGLLAMMERLQWVLHREQLPVRLGSACFPEDGRTPEELLSSARGIVSREPSGIVPARWGKKEVVDV